MGFSIPHQTELHVERDDAIDLLQHGDWRPMKQVRSHWCRSMDVGDGASFIHTIQVESYRINTRTHCHRGCPDRYDGSQTKGAVTTSSRSRSRSTEVARRMRVNVAASVSRPGRPPSVVDSLPILASTQKLGRSDPCSRGAQDVNEGTSRTNHCAG